MDVLMVFLDRGERRFSEVRIPIAKTSTLRRLLASSESRAHFWSAVRSFNPLRLNLLGSWDVDPRELLSLNRLQSLYISLPSFEGLNTVAQLPALELLWLVAPKVTNVAPIAKLTRLSNLLLNVAVSDLTPLSTLKELQSLSLRHAPISDLSPLRKLKRLQLLDLGDTEIESLAALKDCKMLEKLNISFTSVEDLSPLDVLPNLTRLDISEHKLTRKLQARKAAGKLTVNVVR